MRPSTWLLQRGHCSQVSRRPTTPASLNPREMASAPSLGKFVPRASRTRDAKGMRSERAAPSAHDAPRGAPVLYRVRTARARPRSCGASSSSSWRSWRSGRRRRHARHRRQSIRVSRRPYAGPRPGAAVPLWRTYRPTRPGASHPNAPARRRGKSHDLPARGRRCAPAPR